MQFIDITYGRLYKDPKTSEVFLYATEFPLGVKLESEELNELLNEAEFETLEDDVELDEYLYEEEAFEFSYEDEDDVELDYVELDDDECEEDYDEDEED